MGIAEKIIRAETSDDLRHHEYDCAVDTLGAVGMAAASIHPAYLAIYRLKYENDLASRETVKQIFMVWAHNSMLRRQIESVNVPRIAAQAMQKWLFDVCQTCSGTGHPKMLGTPSLSAKPCGSCGGSGRQIMRGSPDMMDIFSDILDNADIAVATVLKHTKRKLKDIDTIT